MNTTSSRKFSCFLLTAALLFCSFKGYSVVHDQYKAIQNLPRNEDLPLFNPHRSSFTCEIESKKVPPVDAQAELWLQEAQVLDDPDAWEEDRDYKEIVQLTRRAAQRRHWKAMLNLASLYLENRDPPHGETDALTLIEEAMRLGVPAAYDRMGTYYMNSIGVPKDVTKAHAFWQKAAEMGNPQAMAYIGDMLSATWDSPNDGFWANIPVATKMLDCALLQGYGPAALTLARLRGWPRAVDGKISGTRTSENKELSLLILQKGVKFGCNDCARRLSVQFRNPHDLADMLVPHLDQARSARYAVLHNALNLNPLLRFPNLDKVLPLPPAPLSPWDGDKQTLIDAAKGVTARPPEPKASAASQRQGRHYLDAGYNLMPSEDKASGTEAPFAGYWQATAPAESAHLRAWLDDIPPGLYQPGEAFDMPRYPHGMGSRAVTGLVWQHFLTVRHDHGAVDPVAASGMTREVLRAQPHSSCDARTPCPVTGTWQPWVSTEHPLHHIINQPWRQAWMVAGEPFPQLDDGGHLPFDLNALTWHLMNSAAPKLG
ncbi:tetratricopeptide repeat protein [Massilia aurea]|uniref:tetratricopeptide repeat protein n=1 Tax=Massilia aurea TaxID=373040 RepID=UPI003462E920